jgi:hypothetical protein
MKRTECNAHEEGSMLWSQLQDIEAGPATRAFDEPSGTLLSYDYQKIREDIGFNAYDIDILTQFANQDDNLEKLGWDLSEPETWQGVQWIYANDEYHVQEISIGGLALSGDLNLSGMEQLTYASCSGNDLASVNVSNCERLRTLFCRNAGISSLNMSDCTTLTVLDCEDNYLNISDIIDEVIIIKTRESAWVSYLEQKVPYSLNISTSGLTFDKTSKLLTLSTVELFAEGVIPDSVYVAINKFDSSGDQTQVLSDTITIDANGSGVVSLAATPVTIKNKEEHVEISVYADSSCTRLVSQMNVMHVLLGS